ncbi:MAG: flagellar type III secretion system protein FliR [Rhodospirillales bacterium]|nr:flagellar type III secretion system protein FliR [Rhodospirillales bacterium]
MLEELISLNIFGFFLIFTRIGTALALMPGFSAGFVPVRMRLVIALGISFVMAPVLMPGLPVRPPTIAGLFVLIIGEFLVGFFFGLIARILIGSLQTAGTVIAYMSSMANALVQDPIAEQQSSTVSSFLLIMATVLIFTTDLHHVMVRALADSYTLLAPGEALPVGDMLTVVARRVADSFALGLRLSAPFVIVGLTYYIGLGLLGRLMPQLQVFFFGLPIQIALQVWVLSVTVTGIMMVFLQNFEDAYKGFILP